MADDEATETEHLDNAAHDQAHERINNRLDEILGIIKGGGRPSEGSPTPEGGRPPDVASMVRAELEKARAEDKSKADADEQHQTLEQRVKALEERAPDPPQPRHQRALWGKR